MARGRPAGWLRTRGGARHPRPRLPRAGRTGGQPEPAQGRWHGARGAGGEVPRGTRPWDGRDPLAHGRRGPRAREARRVVGVERAGLRHGRSPQWAVDRRRPRASGGGADAESRDQQAGSCRDWYCHAHWVWLHEGTEGLLWSGPDTPLFTLNDIVRGQWRRQIAPDGTLLAYAMNNYWHTNYAARQGGEFVCRVRISLLPPPPNADAAEPVRRGWAACDPLY